MQYTNNNKCQHQIYKTILHQQRMFLANILQIIKLHPSPRTIKIIFPSAIFTLRLLLHFISSADAYPLLSHAHSTMTYTWKLCSTQPDGDDAIRTKNVWQWKEGEFDAPFIKTNLFYFGWVCRVYGCLCIRHQRIIFTQTDTQPELAPCQYQSIFRDKHLSDINSLV